VAEDAAADLHAFSGDADRLGDDDVAIPLDRDADVEHGDFFARECRRSEQEREQRQQSSAEIHWPPPRWSAGAARLADSISKYCRALMLARAATMLVGKVSTAVLSSRTAPLK